jgi:hypothetical protein
VIPRRYKQLWFLIIKLSIVLGAGFFIYKRIFQSEFSNIKSLQIISKLLVDNIALFLFILSLSIVNWFFEILKWQVLVKSIQSISFYQALKQSLSSHTLSLITPFKAGEYGGKALYFSKSLRKKVLLLNFIGNSAQLLLTLVFGSLGILYFVLHFQVNIHLHKLRGIAYYIAFFVLLVFAGKRSFLSKKEGFYQKSYHFFKKMSKNIKFKTVLISLLRYLIFSHQFYLMLVLFQIQVPYFTAMMLIFSMYLIAGILPVISLFDFVVKGSIAVYLFSFLQIEALPMVLISTIMWFLNFALPAIIGSTFVMQYKLELKT